MIPASCLPAAGTVLRLHYLWASWEGLWENGEVSLSSDQDATVNWKDVMWVDVMYSMSSDNPFNVNNIPSQWPWICLVGFLDQNPFLLVLSQKWKHHLLTLMWFQRMIHSMLLFIWFLRLRFLVQSMLLNIQDIKCDWFVCHEHIIG